MITLGNREAKIIDKPRVIEVETLPDGTVQTVQPPLVGPIRDTSSVSVQLL